MFKYLVRSMRPTQWVKNLFVFAGLVFAQRAFSSVDGQLVFHWDSILRALGAFGAFCLVSSATYLLNDIRDRRSDAVHPVKRNRPIAAGLLPVGVALVTGIVLFALGLAVAALISWSLLGVLLSYVILTVAYSLWLKHVVILDVLVLAFGFVLRAFAGTVAIDVTLSVWLFIVTILFALFLALTKRRAELTLFERNASLQRAVLAQYTPQFLDQMISVVTASTIVSYAIYTASPSEFHTNYLVLTVPFVIYGIFRYLYLVYVTQSATDPDKTLFKDPPLQITVVLYLLAACAIIYFL